MNTHKFFTVQISFEDFFDPNFIKVVFHQKQEEIDDHLAMRISNALKNSSPNDPTFKCKNATLACFLNNITIEKLLKVNSLGTVGCKKIIKLLGFFDLEMESGEKTPQVKLVLGIHKAKTQSKSVPNFSKLNEAQKNALSRIDSK